MKQSGHRSRRPAGRGRRGPTAAVARATRATEQSPADRPTARPRPLTSPAAGTQTPSSGTARTARPGRSRSPGPRADGRRRLDENLAQVVVERDREAGTAAADALGQRASRTLLRVDDQALAGDVDAPGDARKATAAATSAGVPTGPAATRPAWSACVGRLVRHRVDRAGGRGDVDDPAPAGRHHRGQEAPGDQERGVEVAGQVGRTRRTTSWSPARPGPARRCSPCPRC